MSTSRRSWKQQLDEFRSTGRIPVSMDSVKVALLASAEGRLSIDDQCLAHALDAAGWQADACAWTQDRDWSGYSAVVVRSPYDYINSPEAFLDRLSQIESEARCLLNPLALMRWNLDKRYLMSMQQAAIPAVPSVLLDEGPSVDSVISAADRFQSDSLVLKPLVGASASGVILLHQADNPDQVAARLKGHAPIPCLAQPYLDAIESDGELSLIYFNKRYSHAVCKRPAEDDFRVQIQHGGSVSSIDPSHQLQRAGQALLASQPSPMLYARVDVVRPDPAQYPERYWLMELELIEPELFFRMDNTATSRFIQALNALLN